MEDVADSPEEFASAFEAAFARFQVEVEKACAAQPSWSSRIAAAIRAGLWFAASDRARADLLTNRARAGGADGIARYRRLLAYIGDGLAAGREESSRAGELPPITEQALAGGLLALVAERLSDGTAAELPTLAPEAIQFALTPYLGAEEARRIALLAG